MNTSIVTFLLDRSGSMNACKAATIEGFNAYLQTLKDEQEVKIGFTFLQFDTQSLDKVCVDVPVSDAHPLNNASYQPRGGTPLVDAAVKTIKAVEHALTKRTDTPKVVVCLQTDGYENASTEYTWEELKGLIAQKTAEGWEFNFLGAGIDAYDQAQKMGVGAMHTMSYDSSDLGATRQAFAASGSNAASFGAGRVGSSAYSMAQRSASGDKYVPADLQSGVSLGPVHLTAPVSTALDLTSQTPSPEPKRRQAVPPFTL